MLGFIATDAAIEKTVLQQMARFVADHSFNRITVDGDTSTNDSLIIAATGKAGNATITTTASAEFMQLQQAVTDVAAELAKMIGRDGEGATKLVEVRVTGAASYEDAAKVAFSIANSPLVKTAVAGQDPNWGRIVAAVGKSGAAADRDRLTIRFGDILVAHNGWRAPKYREEDGAAYMKQSELVIAVDLGLGKARRTVWTCDLTSRYIEINADYRS